jgi:hypothetical protein
VASPPKLLWTYPADGAVDVPTNAVFVVIPSAGNTVEAKLDGVDVPKVDPIVYGPVTFQPSNLVSQKDYELTLALTPANSSEATLFTLRFKTATGPLVDFPPALVITSVDRSPLAGDSLPDGCSESFFTQECFDYLIPEQLRFALSSSTEMGAYLVKRSDNGAPPPPVALMYSVPPCLGPYFIEDQNEARKHCYVVSAIWPNGQINWSDPYCLTTEDSESRVDGDLPGVDATAESDITAPASNSDGCSAGTSGHPLSVTILLALLLLPLGLLDRRPRPEACSRVP